MVLKHCQPSKAKVMTHSPIGTLLKPKVFPDLMANFMSSGPHLTTETTSFLPRILRFHSSFSFVSLLGSGHAGGEGASVHKKHGRKPLDHCQCGICFLKMFASPEYHLGSSGMTVISIHLRATVSPCMAANPWQVKTGICKSINIQAVVNVFHELDLPFRQKNAQKEKRKKTCCQETFFCCSNEANCLQGNVSIHAATLEVWPQISPQILPTRSRSRKKTSHVAMR